MSERNQLTHYELEEFFRFLQDLLGGLISFRFCTRRRKKNQQPSEIQLHYEVLPTNLLKYRASGGLEHLISQHPLWDWWLKVVLPPLHAKRNKVSPRNVAFVD